MDDEEQDKYVNNISVPASRNWLKPATVSLAHLDQIKARVYNLGFAEPQCLKGNSKSTPRHVQGHDATTKDVAQPPLSKVPLQSNRWGSSSSIPDLIRQQTERQKMRPQSAKHQVPKRPPSGRRTRPQSAKEGLGLPPEVPRSKNTIGVQGAKYDPSHRPAGGHYHNSTMGWVAPPGGIMDEPKDPADGHADAIQHVLDVQYQHAQYDQGEDITVPPPPRCSPDFLTMLDADATNDGLQEGRLSHMVDDLLGQGHGQIVSKRMLRKPAAPIHFSLPSAEDGQTVFDDEIAECISSSPVNVSSLMEGYIEGSSDGSPIDQYPQKVLFSPKPQAHTPISGLSKRIVNIQILKEGEEDQKDELHADTREHSRQHNVTFDEEHNVTVDITPRQNHIKSKSGKHEGRYDLRYVKSRTDTGLAAAGCGSAGYQERVSSDARSDNSEEDAAAEFQPPRFRNLIANRPKSNKGLTINTVSVNYVEESKSDEESKKEIREKTHECRKNRGKKEIETLISQMELLDGDSDFESEETGAQQGSPAKVVSRNTKNYYDMARTRDTKPGAREIQNEIGDDKPKVKTIKTIQFVDSGVTETKSVSEINALLYKGKDYIAPHPPSASKPRPPSALPPTTAKDKTADENEDELREHIKQSSLNKSTDKTLGKDNTSTAMSMLEAERPASRRGNVDSRVDENRPPSRLKKRRIVSAPVARTHDACGRRIADVTHKPPRSRPSSAKKSAQTEQSSLHSCSFSSLAPRVPLKSKSASAIMKSSTKIHGHPGRQHAYVAPPPARKKNNSSPEVIEIWTRKEDFEVETEGVKECKVIQDKLLDAGVPVTLETLKRALLPPTEYGFSGPSYKTTMYPTLPPNYTNGLLSKPSVWLAAEHKRLQLAKKKVREATAQLMEQEREERRRALSGSCASSSSSLNQKKKKGKGSVKGKHSRAHSAK